MKKVVIVGGGVAGLTCGKRLVESGKFSVKLLEATSRIGGRVETRKLGIKRMLFNALRFLYLLFFCFR